MYKWYVKSKGNLSKHNYMGAPIGQDRENHCENSGEKETMMINTTKIAKKRKQ